MEKTYSKTNYCVSWKTHSKHVFKSLCCLMEHQSLVDIAICCGNKTLHAHKCILAANSHYFKDEFEKNPSVEQIVISGFDFGVLKSIIEFMYCGETIIEEENVKFLIGAAKLFQVRGLDTLFSDRQEHQHLIEDVYIPYPQFMSNKPKYPVAYHAPNNSQVPNDVGLKIPAFNINDPFNKKKLKRKYLRSEAEKACAKEAHASRMALAHLQKEIATTSQVNSFIIEESCTETTVENFIPHADDSCIEVSKAVQPVQLIDYTDTGAAFNCNNTVNTKQNLLQFGTVSNSQEIMSDKLKNIFGGESQSDIEIIFKTNDGNFVTVNDEVLQNISKGGLQYQIVDEDGHVGEIQDLKPATEKIDSHQGIEMIKDFMRSAKISSTAPPSTCTGMINDETRTDHGSMSEFKAREPSLSNADSEFTDRKPIQFMLIDNGDFDDGIIDTYSHSIKITSEKEPSELTKHLNGHDFSTFSAVVDRENSMDYDKSTLKFSPDIFFADPSNSNNETSDQKYSIERRA
ncbi:uncharacterized protein LOC123306870 [Coccinella septempunctata]|uniref:uncharacterized protein LOC123306870 n=1 Tax=Coccinella septempunctata TaxID=41139 RepID=UPI001D095993|nr:uncharacterized protein LOC123306870 [Coccinella septempunctata]